MSEDFSNPYCTRPLPAYKIAEICELAAERVNYRPYAWAEEESYDPIRVGTGNYGACNALYDACRCCGVDWKIMERQIMAAFIEHFRPDDAGPADYWWASFFNKLPATDEEIEKCADVQQPRVLALLLLSEILTNHAP